MDFSESQYDYRVKPEIAAGETPALVSIVLATYNGERYLAQQLASLFNQTYSNIEIIAIDDRSNDKTVEILKEHASRHPNMKVFVNDVNLGFIKNFEKGCTLSTGELIAFCDQDDYWVETKIEKMVAAIGGHSIIYCDSLVCDENLHSTGTKISDLVNFRSWNNPLQLAVFCRIYAHAMIFKRSFFDKALPFLNVIPPDWWLPYLSTFHGGMKYFPEPLILYRQHAGNVTGVIGGKGKKNSSVSKSERQRLDMEKIRIRINAFYNACPVGLAEEKKVLRTLATSYSDFSMPNNFKRFFVFLKYRDTFLSVKKHSALHRFLFCFKMFVKIK